MESGFEFSLVLHCMVWPYGRNGQGVKGDVIKEGILAVRMDDVCGEKGYLIEEWSRTHDRNISTAERINWFIRLPFTLISLPGVVLHLVAHSLTGRLLGLDPFIWRMIRFDKKAGFVVIRDQPTPRSSLWVGISPLFVNSSLSVLLAILAQLSVGSATPVYQIVEDVFPLDSSLPGILLWLAGACGFNALPDASDLSDHRVMALDRLHTLSRGHRAFLAAQRLATIPVLRLVSEGVFMWVLCRIAIELGLALGAVAVGMLLVVVTAALWWFWVYERPVVTAEVEEARNTTSQERRLVDSLWGVSRQWCDKDSTGGLPMTEPLAFGMHATGEVDQLQIDRLGLSRRQSRLVRRVMLECYHVGYCLNANTHREHIGSSSVDVKLRVVIERDKMLKTPIPMPISVDGAQRVEKILDAFYPHLCETVPQSTATELQRMCRASLHAGFKLVELEVAAALHVQSHGTPLDPEEAPQAT